MTNSHLLVHPIVQIAPRLAFAPPKSKCTPLNRQCTPLRVFLSKRDTFFKNMAGTRFGYLSFFDHGRDSNPRALGSMPGACCNPRRPLPQQRSNPTASAIKGWKFYSDCQPKIVTEFVQLTAEIIEYHPLITGNTFCSIKSTLSKILGLNVPVIPTETFTSLLA